MRADLHSYTDYRAEPPTPQQVYKALNYLPRSQALGMVERAALHSGGWTPQLLATAHLVAQRGARA